MLASVGVTKFGSTGYSTHRNLAWVTMLRLVVPVQTVLALVEL